MTIPKPPGFLHVDRPTNAYQDLCSRCETHWSFRFGLPTLTNGPIWLAHRYKNILPTLTSRGVEYTHDVNCVILHHDSGHTRIRLIPKASTPEVIPVGDGGAKHRSIDPPTTWYNVADPHAVATICPGGLGPLTPRPRHPGRTTQL